MTVFVSYSHADRDFVDKLAAHLVKAKSNVWIDRWELNVGDSIIQRVQDALTKSSALLIVLSKASVASEWCKKEVSAGLLRELEEKRVVVLPILLEDCDVPIFLREKMYADFRRDFEEGLSATLDGVSAVTNSTQSRIIDADHVLDWAEDWGFEDNKFHLRYTIIDHPKTLPMTLLTEVHVVCNEVASKRYKQFEEAGIDWLGRGVISEVLFEIGSQHDIRIVLDDSIPKHTHAQLADSSRASIYEVHVVCRKLGDDNGKDQLIDVAGYLTQIRDYVRSSSRQPNNQEQAKMIELLKTPWPT